MACDAHDDEHTRKAALLIVEVQEKKRVSLGEKSNRQGFHERGHLPAQEIISELGAKQSSIGELKRREEPWSISFEITDGVTCQHSTLFIAIIMGSESRFNPLPRST